jgi:hypothetical protein
MQCLLSYPGQSWWARSRRDVLVPQQLRHKMLMIRILLSMCCSYQQGRGRRRPTDMGVAVVVLEHLQRREW